MKPIAELKGTALENSTIGKLAKGLKCLLCGHLLAGGPSRIRDHLLNAGNHIRCCAPYPVCKQRYNGVVAELKRRIQKDKQVLDDKAKQEAARLLVSGPAIQNSLSMRPSNGAVTEAKQRHGRKP